VPSPRRRGCPPTGAAGGSVAQKAEGRRKAPPSSEPAGGRGAQERTVWRVHRCCYAAGVSAGKAITAAMFYEPSRRQVDPARVIRAEGMVTVVEFIRSALRRKHPCLLLLLQSVTTATSAATEPLKSCNRPSRVFTARRRGGVVEARAVRVRCAKCRLWSHRPADEARQSAFIRDGRGAAAPVR